MSKYFDNSSTKKNKGTQKMIIKIKTNFTYKKAHFYAGHLLI